MNRKLLYVLMGCLLMAGIASAETVYSSDLLNDTGVASDSNHDLDLNALGIDSVSAIVTASSSTFNVATFNDGRASTGSFTVSSLTDLTTSFATNKITLLNNTGLTGAQIRLAGVPITEGVDWSVKASTALTAVDITRALNTKFAGVIISTTPPGSAVIFSTAAVAGANDSTFSSSVTTMTVLTPTFTGGRDNAWVVIDGTRLTFLSDIGVGATAALTAGFLATAINANDVLSDKIIAQASGAIVTTTATVVGVAGNYGLTSSTPSAVVPSGLAMTGGNGPAFAINSNVIAATAHGFSTGMGVFFSTASGVGLSPLASNATYYIIKNSADSISLATTRANALAGTAITLLSSGTATTTRSYSLKVPTIAGTPSFKWRVSNDGTYWIDLSSRTAQSGTHVDQIGLASYTLGGTSFGWDFGRIGYRYLRFAVTGPTAGAIWIRNAVVGRRD